VYNHEPPGYDCSLCQLVRGEDNEDPWAKQSDIFYRDDELIAWINPRWWGRIEGNAVIVPNAHFENLFDLPDDLATPIHSLARRLATAMMETYGCAGISTRQHNGPEANQEVWHYHLHVFPRYERSDLYGQRARLVTPDERRPYAERLRRWLEA
jgi:histidine triad (HIT) family protein